MPRWLLIAGGVLAAIYVLGSIGDRRAAQKEEASVTAAAVERATSHLRKEPKIKDIMWTGPMLYVGVLDDGSRRDGYALYVCEVLRDFGSPAAVVHVTDIAAIKFRNDWRKLGTAHCR